MRVTVLAMEPEYSFAWNLHRLFIEVVTHHAFPSPLWAKHKGQNSHSILKVGLKPKVSGANVPHCRLLQNLACFNLLQCEMTKLHNKQTLTPFPPPFWYWIPYPIPNDLRFDLRDFKIYFIISLKCVICGSSIGLWSFNCEPKKCNALNFYTSIALNKEWYFFSFQHKWKQTSSTSMPIISQFCYFSAQKKKLNSLKLNAGSLTLTVTLSHAVRLKVFNNKSGRTCCNYLRHVWVVVKLQF